MKGLENLEQFEVLNEEEIKTIKGGLVAASTVESRRRDDDHATSPEEPEQ